MVAERTGRISSNYRALAPILEHGPLTNPSTNHGSNINNTNNQQSENDIINNAVIKAAYNALQDSGVDMSNYGTKRSVINNINESMATASIANNMTSNIGQTGVAKNTMFGTAINENVDNTMFGTATNENVESTTFATATNANVDNDTDEELSLLKKRSRRAIAITRRNLADDTSESDQSDVPDKKYKRNPNKDDDSDEDNEKETSNLKKKDNVTVGKDDSDDISVKITDVVEDGINYGDVGNGQKIKKELEYAAAAIKERGGRNKVPPGQYEKKYMLSTKEHVTRFGFTPYEHICDFSEVDEELYAKCVTLDEMKNVFIQNEEKEKKYLETLPEEFHSSATCMFCHATCNITEENVAIYSGCRDSKNKLLAHPLHYPKCYTEYITWTSENVNEGGHRLKLTPTCCMCRQKDNTGQWYLSRLREDKSGWIQGKPLPNGIHALAVHHFVDKDKEIDVMNFIHGDKLLFAINWENQFKFGHTPRPASFGNVNASKYYTFYNKLITDRFECDHCHNQCVLMDKIKLKDCKDTCNYRICRNCFISRITSDTTFLNKPRSNGFLQCKNKECNKVSRAVFAILKKHNFVASKDKKGLQPK